eukprot:365338-Chlamydomonas_euryale.AAC.32
MARVAKPDADAVCSLELRRECIFRGAGSTTSLCASPCPADVAYRHTRPYPHKALVPARTAGVAPCHTLPHPHKALLCVHHLHHVDPLVHAGAGEGDVPV